MTDFNLEATLKEQLQAYAPLTADVGTSINSVKSKQFGSYPRVVYEVVADVPYNCLTGYSGLSNARVQMNVYAKTYEETKAIMRNIRKAIAQGGGGLWGLCLSQRDLPFEPGEQIYTRSADFSFHYQETPLGTGGT